MHQGANLTALAEISREVIGAVLHGYASLCGCVAVWLRICTDNYNCIKVAHRRLKADGKDNSTA